MNHQVNSEVSGATNTSINYDTLYSETNLYIVIIKHGRISNEPALLHLNCKRAPPETTMSLTAIETVTKTTPYTLTYTMIRCSAK